VKPEDQDVWVTIDVRYGSATLFFTESDALDHKTRTDKVYKCRMTGWADLEARSDGRE
jgi:hypothetical protein